MNVQRAVAITYMCSKNSYHNLQIILRFE